MVIIVREVSDADIPRVAAIETAAYAINALRPILFPGPFPPDSEQQRVVELTNARKNDPTATYLQAYDEETGQLVAFAKWHIYDTPEKAAAAQRPSRTFGAGTNSKACEAFFGGLAARKKELMGQKTHIHLHMLHTDPTFQGRGAGGMLVEWGTKKADELGLPAYLEASPEGHRVYLRYGFRDLDILKFDMAQFGGEGVYNEPLMLREPSSAKWAQR